MAHLIGKYSKANIQFCFGDKKDDSIRPLPVGVSESPAKIRLTSRPRHGRFWMFALLRDTKNGDAFLCDD